MHRRHKKQTTVEHCFVKYFVLSDYLHEKNKENNYLIFVNEN